MLKHPKAFVIVTDIGSSRNPQYENEFIDLVKSAGIEVEDVIRCQNRNPDLTYFVGKGKSLEIAERVEATGTDILVIDHELSPSQGVQLSKRTKAQVLDRTFLILDIFAQRAISREGKLQVELAQLKYLSTHLVHTWTHLERQKGGIGLRGPGETQLETDRRLVRKRMNGLTDQIEKIKQQRDQRRRKRSKNRMFSISLVGYTNAGKSTLFNALTGENVLNSKRLFSTLDPTVRKLKIDQAHTLLSDTVGFIRNLPHQLIEAFNATLLEINEADLILHAEDISNSERFERREEVKKMLSLIGADQVPIISIFNKIDCIGLTPKMERGYDGKITSVWISAGQEEGLDLLRRAITERIAEESSVYQMCIPPETADLRSFLYRNGTIFEDRYESGKGWMMRFQISHKQQQRFQEKVNHLHLSYSVG